jgi:hypothetical protein
MLKFPHRENPNQTFDSICYRCFATIGNATSEKELAEMEAKHVCDESRLAQRKADLASVQKMDRKQTAP